jgi:hypothetical protein
VYRIQERPRLAPDASGGCLPRSSKLTPPFPFA